MSEKNQFFKETNYKKRVWINFFELKQKNKKKKIGKKIKNKNWQKDWTNKIIIIFMMPIIIVGFVGFHTHTHTKSPCKK